MVWRQGLFYQLNIYDDKNQILSPAELERLFQDIIDDADKHKGEQFDIFLIMKDNFTWSITLTSETQ